MPEFNLLAIPVLLLGLLTFVGAEYLCRRWKELPSRRAVLAAFSAVLALPGAIMALYYLHLFDDWVFYYEFRSWEYTELTAVGVGLAAGVISGHLPLRVATTQVPAALLLCLVLAVPHIKPFRSPIDVTDFRDLWSGPVSIQSTDYSCGPASTATILRHHGLQANELDLAMECFTYTGGTENWYLARALRKRGLEVEFKVHAPDGPIEAPAIAGVDYYGSGHFITVLDRPNDMPPGSPIKYRTGDPLRGEEGFVSEDGLRKRFAFTGFYMVVSKPTR